MLGVPVYAAVAKSNAWTPLDDASLTSGLYLPGGYSVAGAQGVNAVGTWIDQSGNARNFTSQGGINAPTAHALGYPVFTGAASGGLLRSGTSFGDLTATHFFTSAGNGAMVVVAEHNSPLGAYVGNYQNAAMVSGLGASPSFCLDNAGLRITGYDLGGTYQESQRCGIDAGRGYVFAGRWNSVGFQTSANGEDWGVVAPWGAGQVSMDAPNIGLDAKIGQGYGTAYNWTGPIKAVAFYPQHTTLSASKLAQWQTWAETQGLVVRVIALDPGLLSFQIYNKIPFVSLPWAGSNSAGLSATRSITAQGGNPTVGTMLNGLNTADFIATDPDYSTDGVANNVSLSSTAGFFFALVNADLLPSAAGVDYQDGNLYTDPSNAETTMGITRGGYSSAFYDGVYKRLAVPFAAPGVWKMIMTRFDGTNLTARVGRGPWARLALGTLSFLVTSNTTVGRSYAGVNHFDGRLAIRGVAPIAFTYAQIDGLIKWVEETYGVPQTATTIADLAPSVHYQSGYVDTGLGSWPDLSGNVRALTGSAEPNPVATGGYPVSNQPTDFNLRSLDGGFATWMTTGNHHLYSVVDTTAITLSSATTANNHGMLTDLGEYVGLYIKRTGAGPYQYYGMMYEWDTAARTATVEITSLLTGAGVGRIVLQGRKLGGYVWVRASTGAWVKGDACGATGGGTGPRWGGANLITGTGRCAAGFPRTLSEAESDMLAVLGATL